MEIEAKFTVPNRRVHGRLAHLHTLAGYALAPAGTAQVDDEYFDTPDRRLMAAGYACRLRREGDVFLATLKGLGGVAGAVHRRAEHEVRLAAWTADTRGWPESPVRDLALELTRGAPLEPLFGLTQARSRADLMDGERRVAQLSLDAVQVSIGQRPAAYYELEVELAPDGAEADLAAVVAELANVWGLVAEPRSKFERGLALLDARRGARPIALSGEERSRLEAYAAGADTRLACRAEVILACANGLPTREIAARGGLSAGRARFWLRAFRARRMEVFEKSADRQTREPARPRAGEMSDRGTGVAQRPPSRRGPPQTGAAAARPRDAQAPKPPYPPAALPTVIEFCRQHGVDLRHARHVEKQAQALFGALKPMHRLPRKRRKLLRQAALLCTIGAAADPGRPHAAGRDLILAQPLRNVSTADRLALACIVAFQREKVRPEREITLSALEEKQQRQVLALSALLHLAEALDFSRTQTTQVKRAEGADLKQCEVEVAGPQAGVDALQAAARAGLWYQLFAQEMVFAAAETAPDGPTPAADAGGPATTAGPDETTGGPEPQPAARPATPATPAPSAPPDIPPVRPDDAMSEAGRKVLLTHFTRMLANEAGTRLGEDIEALHDMRVATRRMRAAYRVFAAHFDEKTMAPFNKGLQRTGRMLGAVRDLDVLLEKARAYQAGLPAEDGPVLAPLLADWATRREVARRQMLEYLDGPAYRQFVAGFNRFLTTPGAGALPITAGEPAPYQVRHVAPRLIFTRYEAVRAYEPILDGAPITTYHRLRIDFKRLRYALEFFRGVLGPETPDLLRTVVVMQDLLGALQDAYVAAALIQEFLDGQRARRKKKATPDLLAGVESYLATQYAVETELLGQFPEPWAGIVGFDFRRALALAVAAL